MHATTVLLTAFGDIDPKDFETVVLSLVKETDETIWAKRLEEKEHLHRQSEANKAKAEVERLRLERGKMRKRHDISNTLPPIFINNNICVASGKNGAPV